MILKYNLCKTMSLLLTVGTPIITLAFCGELFVHRSETAISTAGLITIGLMLLIFKDKVAENLKVPSAFVLSTSLLILIILIEHILLPVKYVCISTMIATGVDEISFKRIYKRTELQMPDEAKLYKYIGYYVTTSKKINDTKKE